MRDSAYDSGMGLLTVEEAAPLIGMSPAHLRRLCAGGKVSGAVKKGRVWLVYESSLRKVVRRRAPRVFAAALGLAFLAWPTFSWTATTYTFNYSPTPLEVTHHQGCDAGFKYLECLAGGRANSPGSQFLDVERHPTYAGLTQDDLADIRANGWNYICDRPEYCAS